MAETAVQARVRANPDGSKDIICLGPLLGVGTIPRGEMELITAKEVAQMVKCSVAFVYRHWKMFGGIRLGGLLRFNRIMVEEVINERLQASEEVAVRLLARQHQTQGGRLSVKDGSDPSRSKGKRKSRKDEFGLHAFVREQA